LRTKNPEIIQQVMNELQEHTLSAIPSHFGRFVYLASLRDENSAEYRHFGMEKLYPRDQCDLALLQTHRNVFYDWLRLTLAEQREDLLLYLRDIGEDPATVLQTWRKLESFRVYPPAETAHGDLELYLSDLRILLELLLDEETA